MYNNALLRAKWLCDGDTEADYLFSTEYNSSTYNFSFSFDVDTRVLTIEVLDPEKGSGTISRLTSMRLFSGLVQTLVIGEGITDIRSGAFENCIELTSVSLPEGLESIGQRAFLACTALESIEIPDSVTSIGDGAFHQCIHLKTVRLPAGLTALGEHTFAYCAELEDIVLPDSLTELGIEVFTGCTGLRSVNLPAGLTEIPGYCFYDCTSLTSVRYARTQSWREAHLSIAAGNNALLAADWTYQTPADCTAILRLPDSLLELRSNALTGTDAQIIIIPSGCQ